MISVVVPARDEAGTIERVVRQLERVLASQPHEIWVVDDGSTDHTGARARAAGAKVLRLEGRGYGAAIKAAARKVGGELFALIDGDGSYPAEALPELIAEVRNGARQAIAARPGFSGAEHVARSAVKAAFRGAVKLFGGVEVPDLNSGLRVLRTDDVRRLSPLLPDRFSASTTLTLAIAADGYRNAFVPIAYFPREGRSKWRPVRDTWRMGKTVARGIGWIRAGHSPLARRGERTPPRISPLEHGPQP